jgi:asparagine synthase (glutamine-hydrolysing)
VCGIAGLIGNDPHSTGSEIVRSMMSAMDHRGPDDRGLESWEFGSNKVVLGHTRLSIIDLSAAGHQPMTERSGRYSTVFNGEIYNFKELRKLLDPGHQLFQTGTDTEAILHAYHRWAEGGFRALRGMFAFALLDNEARLVHLVRDPLGIKPLYYYADAGGLLFASEVSALLASGQVPHRINPNGVNHFLSYGWIGSSETSVSGIRMLPPGHAITVDLKGEAISWQTARYVRDEERSRNSFVADRNENTAHILHLLEESVKSHLVSDVPIGLFLSGGIDSTAILQLMRSVGQNVPKTFTVVFEEKEFSEHQYAREVARLCDAEHHELNLNEEGLLSELPCALAAMDQPTMDGVNTFFISKAVRSAGITVALSGLGADELFAGYPSFRRARLAKVAATAPHILRAGMAACGRHFGDNSSREKFWDLLQSDGSPVSAYEISRRLFSRSEIENLLQPGSESRSSAYSNFASVTGDVINDVSRLELQGYMTDLLLRDTDFMSMASSLEVRVPFIDTEVVRYALQLPGSWKVAGSKPKPLLLESMRGTIPDYVWNRKKMGFTLPFDRWMRSALRGQVEETLCSRQLAEQAGLVPKSVEKIWRNFLGGSTRWSKPWSLFALLKWCERQGASI